MDMEEPYNVLDSVQRQIVDGTITFEEAAMKYSQDKYSKQNGGLASNLEQLEIMNYGDPTEASVKFYKDYLNPDDFRALEKLEIDGVSKPYTTQDYRQRTLCKVVKLKEVIPSSGQYQGRLRTVGEARSGRQAGEGVRQVAEIEGRRHVYPDRRGFQELRVRAFVLIEIACRKFA